jgi:quinol monooxygenase YgiN
MLMKTVFVRYKVKADRAAENVAFIKQVFAQLEAETPSGLHYASFQQNDGVSFVHLSAFETADGSNPLTALSAFKAFSAAIKDRCDEPPVVVELAEVGSYRFFDA